MIEYKVGNYTFSTDLTRYAKEVGKEGNYTIGSCIVEFIEAGSKVFTPEPKFIDTTKPYELLDIDPDTGLRGRFAVQETPFRMNVELAEVRSWTRKASITGKNGDLDAVIYANLTKQGRPHDIENYEHEFNRLLIQVNTPKEASPETVSALIRHTSEVKARNLQTKRVRDLAEKLDITIALAQALAACEIDGGIIYREHGWHTPKALFVSPPAQGHLNLLVERGLMQFTDNTYTATDLGRKVVRDHYL
ncbi:MULTISPECIES: hypothetical protein [unclassified Vibrio]|uniref:hypothetical protein n=1 Tax=unclassified Vibrio TaxID=2614977 RepID=UPI001269649C|nr:MULTISPECIES: hypothetical protein [unclassified Vibrio]QFT40076.1 hypothetical protein FIU99_27170 [Vibrio sp. THAF64]QGM38021.1 hypothetical protein GGC04_27375 [Vibrio sp. THAF191d]QGN73519.1 hypothetical protein GGC03_27400 [Vibrio sp. THAF191c]